MVIDSSALIAILLKEDGFRRYAEAIADAESNKTPAGSVLEVYLVLAERAGPHGSDDLDALLDEMGIEVRPFDQAQAIVARRAFHRFGKGRHPARLNFGDCMSYALATVTGEPLLFKGDDFSKTDVVPALRP